jgi:hypothetical protein
VARDLERDVGGGAEAIETEAPAPLDRGAPQGPEADHAGTQQRRGLHIAEDLRDGIRKRLEDADLLGVTSVLVPAGKGRRPAQILTPLEAVQARTTALVEPREPDALPFLETIGSAAASQDASNHLMTGRDPLAHGRKLSLHHVEVGSAHPADGNPDDDLPLFGLRLGDVLQDERRGVNGRRFLQDHRTHLGGSVPGSRVPWVLGRPSLQRLTPTGRQVQPSRRAQSADSPGALRWI